MIKTAKSYIEVDLLINKENKNIICYVYDKYNYGIEYEDYNYDYEKIISNEEYGKEIGYELIKSMGLVFDDREDIDIIISLYLHLIYKSLLKIVKK